MLSPSNVRFSCWRDVAYEPHHFFDSLRCVCPLPVQAIKEAFKQHRIVKEHITIRDVALEAAAKAKETQQSAPAPEPEYVPGVHSGGLDARRSRE